MFNGWSLTKVGFKRVGYYFLVVNILLLSDVFIRLCMFIIFLFIPRLVVYVYSSSLFIFIPSYHPYYSYELFDIIQSIIKFFSNLQFKRNLKKYKEIENY